MTRVSVLEYLRCHTCGQNFPAVREDLHVHPLVLASFPVPKRQTCNMCLRIFNPEDQINRIFFDLHEHHLKFSMASG